MIKIALVILVLAMADISLAQPFTITFRDSTQIEDAHILSGGTNAQCNYGRALAAGYPVVISGTASTNFYYPFFKIPAFKDSCDNHPGMIIDSAKLIVFIKTTAYDVNDQAWLAAVGIDTNMTWEEGNKNGAVGSDCDLCYDSAQKIGGGSCASALDWNSDGANGAGDTMGLYLGEPEDSTVNGGNQVFDFESNGDSLYIYLDTVMMDLWKDYAGANEGFKLHHWGGPVDVYYNQFYSSEQAAGQADSTPYVIVYAHEAETGFQQMMFIGQRNVEDDQIFGRHGDRFYCRDDDLWR